MTITTCPKCDIGNLVRPSAYQGDGRIECMYCGHLFVPENEVEIKVDTKPPLGVKPCRIHAEQRIKDLNNAILRNIGSGKPKYDSIRKWATEIVLQCDLAEIVDRGN